MARQCRCCGADDGCATLLRCSRCRSEWFCSAKCQSAIWPFHRSECDDKANELADALEDSAQAGEHHEDPNLIQWMRSHNKQAVLRSKQVDRIERGSASIKDFFGKTLPEPHHSHNASPSNGLSSLLHRTTGTLAHHTMDDTIAIASNNTNSHAISALDLPDVELGQRCIAFARVTSHSLDDPVMMRLQWQQSLYTVRVLCESASRAGIVANDCLRFYNGNGSELCCFRLHDDVSVDESYWLRNRDIGCVEVFLSKLWRKGRYRSGSTSADTFWTTLVKAKRTMDKNEGGQSDPIIPITPSLPGKPPVRYYFSENDPD